MKMMIPSSDRIIAADCRFGYFGERRPTGQLLQKSSQITLFTRGQRERVQIPFEVDVLATAFFVELDDVGEFFRAAVVKVGRGQRDITQAGRAIRADVEDL